MTDLDEARALPQSSIDVLADLAATESAAALPLFKADPERAFAMDLHRKPGSRRAIIDELLRRGRSNVAPHLARLLDDHDLDVVRCALGLDGLAYGPSALETLIQLEPELVPVDTLRALTGEREPDIAVAAVTALSKLHLPEDAARVLQLVVAEQLAATDVEWLAPLAGSELLAPTLDAKETYELLRRRRCAGLSITLDHRTVVRRALSAKPGPFGADLADKLELEHAARIVAEVGDRELAPELVVAIDLEADTQTLEYAFALLGDAGRAALDAAIGAEAERSPRVDGFVNAPTTDHLARERRLWIREAIGRWVCPRWMTLAGADERFATGNLENGLLVDHAAYGSYAHALLADPGSAHAAFQLAWIDRGFGTPIVVARIAWIRSLGVHDNALLDELARPVPPLPDCRFKHLSPQTEHPEPLARRAEAAGFASIAAGYWALAGRTRDVDRARAATQRHLARVRSACT
jgi:hypothetical protein